MASRGIPNFQNGKEKRALLFKQMSPVGRKKLLTFLYSENMRSYSQESQTISITIQAKGKSKP